MAKGQKPTHAVYTVRDYEKEEGKADAFFTQIGAAWPTKDNQGFTIELDAFPVSGRLVVLPIKDKRTAENS